MEIPCTAAIEQPAPAYAAVVDERGVFIVRLDVGLGTGKSSHSGFLDRHGEPRLLAAKRAARFAALAMFRERVSSHKAQCHNIDLSKVTKR